MCNYIHNFIRDIITRTFPNLNGGLTKRNVMSDHIPLFNVDEIYPCPNPDVGLADCKRDPELKLIEKISSHDLLYLSCLLIYEAVWYDIS